MQNTLKLVDISQINIYIVTNNPLMFHFFL
jgi:hypothetical protein